MTTTGNIGTGDAAVLALLADTARAGRGWGGWGGGYGGEGGYGGHGGAYGPYASATALQHSVDRNAAADIGRDIRETVQEQSQDLRSAFANQNLKNAVEQIGGGQTQSERRIVDLLSGHQINALRENADFSRQIAACCCDTQKGFLEQAMKAQECCCDTQKLLLEQQLENQKCCCETQKLTFQENQNTRNMIMDNELRRATDANNVSATVGAINGGRCQSATKCLNKTQGKLLHYQCKKL
jgi:hypothetical protein